jgi:L-fuconolactonase
MAVLPAFPADAAVRAGTTLRLASLVDTHVHFYDPKRPSGVPWPPKEDPLLYRTVLPADYAALAQPSPVTAVIVVEASPWLEDNQWVLDLAAGHPLILGVVGHLPVGGAGFSAHLKRLATNPVFRGLRIRPAPTLDQWQAQPFLNDLKALADHDLSLDLVGGAEVLGPATEVAQKIPALRIVIDHLAGVQIDGKSPARAWQDGIRAAARRKNVFMKVSGLVEGTGRRAGQAPQEVEYYRPTLDAVWDAFGEERLIYGSNWPVCEHFANLAKVQQLALDYFAAKGQRAMDRVFSGNSRKAYHWLPRRQPARL